MKTRLIRSLLATGLTVCFAPLSLAATGAVVGGIHGLALVRLVHRPRPGTAR